jgi:hypothetical protein
LATQQSACHTADNRGDDATLVGRLWRRDGLRRHHHLPGVTACHDRLLTGRDSEALPRIRDWAIQRSDRNDGSDVNEIHCQGVSAENCAYHDA